MNGILVCHPLGNRKNIGDYIQSVAQEQYWDKTDCFVEREQLSNIQSDEKINVIMNGWFMIKPQNYPPQLSINPFYISFHIDKRIAPRMLTDDAIKHLKQYMPIGCRDTDTRDLLENYGVKAYFSGCLTTTLHLKYLDKENNGVPVFVDPYYEVAGTRKQLKNWKLYIKNLWWTVRYWRKTGRFAARFENEFWTWYGRLSRRLERRICASAFYASYHHYFTDEMLCKAEYITHNVESERFHTEEEWMEYARQLIRKYAHARYVVTSRIHCALPCLGVETPCVFITTESLHNNTLRDNSRFGGLIEMFNVAEWKDGIIKALTPSMKKLFSSHEKLGIDAQFINPDNYKPYRDEMVRRTKEFVKSTK